MIKAVIFDLGHTLIRFSGDLVDVNRRGVELMHKFLESKGINLELEPFYRRWTEMRLKDIADSEADLRQRTADETLRKVLKDFGIDSLPDELITKAIDIFFEPEAAHYEVYPDAHETLKYLKNKNLKLALLSNATCDRLIKRLVDDAGMTQFFDFITSSAGLGIRKPHPDAFRPVLKVIGAEPSQAVMVGDVQEMDILGAHNVGMRAILVHKEPVKYNDPKLMPDWAVKNLSEVIDVIEKLGI